MWWKVNLSKFAGQLVPPVLRSNFLTGLLQAFLAPLRSIVERFNTDRTTRLEDIRTTPQAGVLEVLLNSLFGYPEVDPPIIRVEDTGVVAAHYLHLLAEAKPEFWFSENEGHTPPYYLQRNEAPSAPTIRVVVPKLLQSEETAISDYLAQHVAAGRRWYIHWYDY